MRAPRPFDLVIFDLDDTLIDLERGRRLDVLSALTGHSASHIHATIWDSDFECAAERGAYSSGEAYLRAFNARLGTELSRAQWIAARAAAMHPRPGMIELLREVGRRTNVALLTNNGALLREALPELAPVVCALIPRLHASCEFQARKPEPEVFTRLIGRYGITPPRALFIDDSAEYVAGAQSAGLAAVRFSDERQVRAALIAHGILEGAEPRDAPAAD